MKTYESLVDALDDLKARGYTNDFNIADNCLECKPLSLVLHPNDFEVVEVHRFEGMTDPDDQSILFAIEAKVGFKGTLVNGYGLYSDPVSDALMAKLNIVH
jgi:hypothetical protein